MQRDNIALSDPERAEPASDLLNALAVLKPGVHPIPIARPTYRPTADTSPEQLHAVRWFPPGPCTACVGAIAINVTSSAHSNRKDRMKPMLWEKELQVARSAAMHAGDLARGYQAQELKPESKPDLSPVTVADRECEKLIVAEILALFPEDGLLGEEGRRSQEPEWSQVDSRSDRRDARFRPRLPFWAVLIGLEVDGEVVVGVTQHGRAEQDVSRREGQRGILQ